MIKLLNLCSKIGIKVYKYNRKSFCIPQCGVIYLNHNSSNVEYDLAHEMGHIVTFMSGDSEKKFPHLRSFRKTGKMKFKSQKFMRSVFEEELEAWMQAEEILKTLGYLDDSQIDRFNNYKESNLETYRNEHTSTR
jgi:SMC interacting uncharacterized protein involved in chromosome segregation